MLELSWRPGALMDKLKDGSSSYRQALTVGDAGVLEGCVFCFCSLVPAWLC